MSFIEVLMSFGGFVAFSVIFVACRAFMASAVCWPLLASVASVASLASVASVASVVSVSYVMCVASVTF